MIRLAFLALLLASPARSCETALLLAIDISGSIDAGEYALQVQGLADALTDPEVADALVQGQVALAVVQWSGVGAQALVLPWRRMLTQAEVGRFADTARALPRAFSASDTAVGQAMTFATAQFAAVPDCDRHVIDISGDGPENAGFTVGRARQMAEAAGVEVNAIAIEDMGPSSPISNFYNRLAITKGGFVMTARGLGDYPRAIRAKLLREITRPGA
jgi:Ca-activated chloride channel homolog